MSHKAESCAKRTHVLSDGGSSCLRTNLGTLPTCLHLNNWKQ
jgi:hypothetical protein